MVLVSTFSLFLSPTFMASAWYCGPWTTDINKPGYSTHDWIAEHALDWLPASEKVYLKNNLGPYLYGTELPDREQLNGGKAKYGHSVLFYLDGTIYNKGTHAGVGASFYFNESKKALGDGDYPKAAENAGVMTHYISDVAVWAHATNLEVRAWWGMETEENHKGYESYVEETTKTYKSVKWDPYLKFDGSLDYMGPYNATVMVAWNATYGEGEEGRFNCTWMNATANDWSNANFTHRTGRLLNLAVNTIADVLHTLAVDMGYGVTPTEMVQLKINEIELDPPGSDAGAEWVELYNPTRKDVDLSYWLIKNDKGAIWGFKKGSTLLSGGYLTVTFAKEWLNNANGTITLLTQSEDVVDVTPPLSDLGNNGTTWARVPNGRDTDSIDDWSFVEPTKNSTNPDPPRKKELPAPAFTVLPEEGNTLTEYEANASASYDPDGSIVSYEWDWGDGSPSSFGVIGTHNFSEAAMYVIDLTVTDDDGQSSSTNLTIKVDHPPADDRDEEPVPNQVPVAFLDADRTTVIARQSVKFSGARSFDPDGYIVSYLFDFGDNTTSGWTEGDAVSHSYGKVGEYLARLTVIDNRSEANVSSTITIKAYGLSLDDRLPTMHLERVVKNKTVDKDLNLSVRPVATGSDDVDVKSKDVPEWVWPDDPYVEWEPDEDGRVTDDVPVVPSEMGAGQVNEGPLDMVTAPADPNAQPLRKPVPSPPSEYKSPSGRAGPAAFPLAFVILFTLMGMRTVSIVMRGGRDGPTWSIERKRN